MEREKKYNEYSAEFKREVIEWKEATGASYGETRRKYGIPSNKTIKQWEKKYQEGGFARLQEDRRGRMLQPAAGSQEALLRELEYLRAENAFLKKLNALVQAEEEASKRRR